MVDTFTDFNQFNISALFMWSVLTIRATILIIHLELVECFCVAFSFVVKSISAFYSHSCFSFVVCACFQPIQCDIIGVFGVLFVCRNIYGLWAGRADVQYVQIIQRRTLPIELVRIPDLNPSNVRNDPRRSPTNSNDWGLCTYTVCTRVIQKGKCKNTQILEKENQNNYPCISSHSQTVRRSFIYSLVIRVIK